MTIMKFVFAISVVLASAGWVSSQQESGGGFKTGKACCVCEPYITSSGNLAMGCPCDKQFGGAGCHIEGLTCSTFGTCGAQ